MTKFVQNISTIGIILILLIIVVLGALVINAHNNKQNTKNNNKVLASNNLNGAAQFTQNVYNAYLQDWGKSQADFVHSHQAWFTTDFINNASDNRSTELLFCNNPSQKPDMFSASIGGKSSSFTTVYISGKQGSHAVVKNLSVQLKSTTRYWTISSINCNLY